MMMDEDEITLSLRIDNSNETPPPISPPPNWYADEFLHQGFKIYQHKPLAKPLSAALPFVTLPDIAQNPSTFANLFSLSHHAESSLCLASYHLHISYPGHEPGASDVDASNFQMDHLVRTYLAILDRFQISKVLALGVGTGATVVLRAAAERPSLFKGLMLISPLIHPEGRYERLSSSVYGFLANRMNIKYQSSTTERLWARWLTDAVRDDPNTILSLEEGLSLTNMNNVLHFLQADTFRESCEALIPKITAHVLMMSGRSSNLRSHCLEAISHFNSSRTSWIEVALCGSLVHEEQVERVVRSIDLFIKGLPL